MTLSKGFPTTTSCGPFIYPPGGTLRGNHPAVALSCDTIPQQLRAILRNRPTANNSLAKLYICSLLLPNACDTETNSGPGADHSTVYPCGACDMPVTRAQQAVACETCSVWYHIDCQGISSQTYDALHSSAVVWNCHSCGVTNYTATLFDLTSLVTSNSFSSLQEDSSIHSIGGRPGPPLAATSPHQQLCGTATHVVSPTIRQHYLT